jgi:AcrR family transcriptional regulator
MSSAKLTTRAAQAAQTRQRIIEATWNVIAEKGLAALTTRTVAREAGISHGMCHYHFAGKDDLVLAVVDFARHYWITPMEEIVARKMPAMAKLKAVISWMAEPATREVMRVHLELFSHSEWEENLRARMAAEYSRWQQAYVEVFAQLKDEGALKPGIDPEAVGVSFATAADGLVWQQSLNPALNTERLMWAIVAPLLTDRAYGPSGSTAV